MKIYLGIVMYRVLKQSFLKGLKITYTNQKVYTFYQYSQNATCTL